MEIVKAGTTKWGSKLLGPQGEAGSWEFATNCMLVCWALQQESQTFHFIVGIFFIYIMCRSCSASFWISLRGNCSVYSNTLVMSMRRRNAQESPVSPFWSGFRLRFFTFSFPSYDPGLSYHCLFLF